MKFEFVEEGRKEMYTARIKVIGVGGAGGNAVNNMIASNLRGVDFVVANTDCQDLDRSLCTHKIQLGPSITMGLGAGADPEIGRLSAEESINEIRESLDAYDMVFITAGMGGGTGTGACPTVAEQCKKAGALTVGIVTKPFEFEGKRRMRMAIEGIEKLKKEVDSLIVIPNERLNCLVIENGCLKDLFAQADDVLLQAVTGISDLIRTDGLVNLDFADVKKVMEYMGTAIMGTGRASGENRTAEAAQKAMNSPLLEDISIDGAKGLLMNICGPSDMPYEEIREASRFIKDQVPDDAEIFWGVVLDDSMNDEVQVTVIATGIDAEDNMDADRNIKPYSKVFKSANASEHSNVVNIRDLTPEEAGQPWTIRMNGEDLDVPTFQRKKTGVLESGDISEAKNATGKKPRKGFLARLGYKDDLDYPTFLRLKAD